MTHKSHLALILPIAIREPRETKKTNLWISLGHESTASGLLNDLQNVQALLLFWLWLHLWAATKRITRTRAFLALRTSHNHSYTVNL